MSQACQASINPFLHGATYFLRGALIGTESSPGSVQINVVAPLDCRVLAHDAFSAGALAVGADARAPRRAATNRSSHSTASRGEPSTPVTRRLLFIALHSR